MPVVIPVIILMAVRFALLAPQRPDRFEFEERIKELEGVKKVMVRNSFGVTTVEGVDAQSFLQHLQTSKRGAHFNLMKKMVISEVQIYTDDTEYINLRVFFGPIYSYKGYYFEMNDDPLPGLTKKNGGAFPISMDELLKAKTDEAL